MLEGRQCTTLTCMDRQWYDALCSLVSSQGMDVRSAGFSYTGYTCAQMQLHLIRDRQVSRIVDLLQEDVIDALRFNIRAHIDLRWGNDLEG